MTKCQMNHKNDPDGWPEAEEAFALLMPDPADLTSLIPQTLHVCRECNDELVKASSDWIALVCSSCGRGQWSYRPQADRRKLPPDMKVLWCKQGCPVCLEEEWNRMKERRYGRVV